MGTVVKSLSGRLVKCYLAASLVRVQILLTVIQN